MSNVIVDKNKIDILANAISLKSGEPVTMTLDEMVEAVDGIESGITPTGNIDITQAGVTDVTNYATATVATAQPYVANNVEYITRNNTRYWRATAFAEVDEGQGDTAGFFANERRINGDYYEASAIASGTSVTPTESAQTIGGANVMMEGAVTVNAIPSNYVGTGIIRRDSTNVSVTGSLITVASGYYESSASKRVESGSYGTSTVTRGKDETYHTQSISFPNFASGYFSNAPTATLYLPLQNKSVTPSTSQQTVTPTSEAYYLNSVTVNPIPSEYIIPSGTKTIDSAGTIDVTQYASASVASGSATASATKGAVSNHSVSVTPSVTRTAGYVTAGTSSGTAVTVTASELVSGSQTITQNGTVNVTNLAEVVVEVQGGGGGMSVATATKTLSTAASSIQFTSLSGQPTSFVVTSSADQNTGGTKAIAVAYDGTSIHGMDLTTQVTADTGFTQSYSNGTLTITATTASFQANEYKLVYTYGGSSANLGTDDVQVGSGATSISFTGLSDEPDYFSCIFTSNFSTSSGYQRVISVVYDGNSTYGLAMDSGAKAISAWTYTYNNGTLTITSSGTNNGGYFHQPGDYHLTYGYGGTVEPTEIEVEPLSVTTNGTYTAPTGKAYSPVTVNVSGGGSVHVATTTWTNSTNTVTSHQFTGLSGTPKAAFLRCTSSLTRSSSSSNYFIADIRWDGSTTGGVAGNSYRRSNGNYANVTSGYSVSTSSNSITFTSNGSSTANPGSFYNGTYELTYIY